MTGKFPCRCLAVPTCGADSGTVTNGILCYVLLRGRRVMMLLYIERVDF